MALPAALVSALGFGLPVVAVATGAVLFATAGPVASPGGVGVATVWLDSPHEASVLAAGEVPVVVHATADRAPTSLVLVVEVCAGRMLFGQRGFRVCIDEAAARCSV